MARDAGFAYVEFLGGYSSRSRFGTYTIVIARPSASPAAPTACRDRKPGTCYTASVEQLLARLSGESGEEPGVGILTPLEDGRKFRTSAYGWGAVAWSGPPPPEPAIP